MRATALLDSNVVVAALVERHVHHAPSLALFERHDPSSFAIAAHSYAEAYCVLTRGGEGAPFRVPAGEAWVALERLRSVTSLVGLTPTQTFDALRDYARQGGIGPRAYDALIGQAAVVYGLSTIVTWNARHMAGLFMRLSVVTPEAFVTSS